MNEFIGVGVCSGSRAPKALVSAGWRKEEVQAVMLEWVAWKVANYKLKKPKKNVITYFHVLPIINKGLR